MGVPTVNASLTGNTWDWVDGGYYYNAYTGYTSPTGTYGGLEPSDLILINDGAGTFSLTFDMPLVDSCIALVSVGTGWRPATYSFDFLFTVISDGSNYWCYGGYSVNGNVFTGAEFDGILHSRVRIVPSHSISFNLRASMASCSLGPRPCSRTSQLAFFRQRALGLEGTRRIRKRKAVSE